MSSVIVFSTPTCPWCTKVKDYLRANKIAFKNIDVSRDVAAQKEMVRKSGQMGVPQLWIRGRAIVGFDKAKINSLLNIK